MVAQNYAPSLARLLVHEGGFVDHPKDPGGATMKGVTQRVYDAYRARNNLMSRHVRLIEDSELQAIYRTQYADQIKFDRLPIGLDYVVFDGAANSGPAQSVKWLQRGLGSLYRGKVDGVVGNLVLEAIDACTDIDALIAVICDRRKAFLKALKGFATFGRGWMARVAQVGDAGQDWATGSAPSDKDLVYVDGMQAKAFVDTAALPSAPVVGPTAGAGGGALAVALEAVRQQIEPYAGVSTLATNVLLGLVVAGGLVSVGGLAYGAYARQRRTALADVLDLDQRPVT